MDLKDFVAKYPPTKPRVPGNNADELRQLGPTDGVLLMVQPPANGAAGQADDEQSRHLWVFRPADVPHLADVPYLLESAPRVAPRLASGVAKHTNLTGGGLASCGGELWVDEADSKRLLVNGFSGRYGPTSREQLDDAVDVFRSLGFDVTSFGWDDETQRPFAVLFR